MTIEDEYQVLSRLELFENLDPVKLKRLIFVSQRYHLQAGEYLFRQGDTTFNPYGIISGEFSVLLTNASNASNDIKIAVQGEGALIGDMAVLSGEPRSASMRANCDSEVIEFDTTLFINTVANDPRTALQMMKILATRIAKMDRKIEALGSDQIGN